MKTQKVALLAVFASMAIVLSIIESFIPSFGIPGIKLGLANIIILLILYEFSFKEALVVNLSRIYLSALLRGMILQMGFLMSIMGGFLSLIFMWIGVKFLKKLTVIGVSIIGALMHIIGQFIIAIIFLQTIYILYYLPFLLLISLLTGVLNGIVVINIRRTKVIQKLKTKYNI